MILCLKADHLLEGLVACSPTVHSDMPSCAVQKITYPQASPFLAASKSHSKSTTAGWNDRGCHDTNRLHWRAQENTREGGGNGATREGEAFAQDFAHRSPCGICPTDHFPPHHLPRSEFQPRRLQAASRQELREHMQLLH